MRVVAIKTVEQADMQALHRTRSLLVKHRTAVINQIRGLLAEYGLVIAPSPEKVRPAFVRFLDEAASGLTACARDTFAELYEQLTELESRLARVTERVERLFRAHPVCRKLAAVPGIGPLTATALLAAVGRPQAFRNGRHLAAWLGLVPRQCSSGGHARLGGLSKRGNRYVRTLPDSWCACGGTARGQQNRCARTMDVGPQTPQRDQCRRGGRRQQKCAGDLGLVGP